MNWFKLNEMVANPEKFQLSSSGLKEGHELSIETNGEVIKLSDTIESLPPNLHLTSMSRLSANRQTTRLKLFQGL